MSEACVPYLSLRQIESPLSKMRRVIEPNQRSQKEGKKLQKTNDDPRSLSARKDAISSKPVSISHNLINQVITYPTMVKVISLALLTSIFFVLWIYPNAMNLSNDQHEALTEGVIALKSPKHSVPPKAVSTAHDLELAETNVIILEAYPHDAKAFTQGLLVVQKGREKYFIESTGLYGESTLRKVDITSGKVLTQKALPSKFFGEGVTFSKNRFIMLTWRSGKGFTYELSAQKDAAGLVSESFVPLKTFTFDTQTGEGWGIDENKTHLILSDGSSRLYVLSPDSLKQISTIEVTLNGHSLKFLNELEVVGRYIYANVWYENIIVKIDSGSGKVVAVYDCTKVLSKVEELALAKGVEFRMSEGAVLNGIAYDGDLDVFYITGKLWPFLFRVRLVDSTV